MIKFEKRKKVEINLIPMINIIFLLLIFFMLTGTIQKQLNPKIQRPDSSFSTKNDNIDSRIINITLNEKGELFIDNKLLSKKSFSLEIKKKNSFFLALLFSMLIHIFGISVLSIKKKENIEKTYTIVNLGSFKSYYPPKKIIKKQVDDPKPIKKIETPKVSKPEIKKKIQKNSKKKADVQLKIEKKEIIEKDLKKKTENISSNKNKQKITKTKSIKFQSNQSIELKNKELTKYLKEISEEINILANNSYPRRSIKRNEQGKIVIRISINSSGKIISINTLTKRPINLVKAAKKILKEKDYLKKPPKLLFEDSNKVIFEIPINYILR